MSDRFLGLPGERAKAERLARLAPDLDLRGLAEAYYAMTPDVEPRRRGFYLGHILEGEVRGSALASLLPSEGKILEVGCGTGGLLAAATRMGLEIEGVDIALRWLVVARRRLDDLGLVCPLVAASAEQLPYQDATFDAVVADSVLEHLDDPRAALEEWARVLRPGGSLLVWSPNRYALTVDPHVRLWGLGWLPRGWMPAYVRWRRGGAWPPPCLSVGEARRMARVAGFKPVEVEPPAISGDWAKSRPHAQQRLIGIYSLLLRRKMARVMLGAFGPLWQLRATRAGGGMTFDHRGSMGLLFASELFAGAVGFGVMVTLARRLGLSGFADYEYASAVAAWWLVVVRGGFDSIVYREAARRPVLVRPLTDLLIGLRIASALVGMAAVLGFAWASGGDRGWVVATAGLVLIPSALASDVGLRASGRFGGLAMAQAVRAACLAGGVAWLVARPDDTLMAAACMVTAEAGSSVVLSLLYRSEHGWIRPRFRRRAWAVLARRGAVAGACRFARVGLYAVDILILGALAMSTLGTYAAARRVAFALLAMGLVVPSAVAPGIARAWASGVDDARSMITRTVTSMMRIALPATIGLMATADRWMPRLFGGEFVEGGPWLALIAARLPFVLASNVQQAALIACRREGLALRLMLGMVALGAVALPPMALTQGAWGVGVGVLGVEVLGAIGGWLALSRLGLAPPWHHASGSTLAGCLGLIAICWIGRDWPLAGVVVAGAGVYGGILILLSSSLLQGVRGVASPTARGDVSRRVGLSLPVMRHGQGKPYPMGNAPRSDAIRHAAPLAPDVPPRARGKVEARAAEGATS